MSDRIERLVKEAQRRIFRLAARDHGLELKQIAADSGIKYDTLLTYRSEDPSMMPISALLKLVDVIPDYLLSQLLEPVQRHLAANESEDGDLAELGREAARFTAEYVDATSDGTVTSIEAARLREGAVRLGSAAGKVASA